MKAKEFFLLQNKSKDYDSHFGAILLSLFYESFCLTFNFYRP